MKNRAYTAQIPQLTIFDNLFWFFLFLYTDPGGYQFGYFNQNIYGNINFQDVIIVVLATIYFISPKINRSSNKIKSRFTILIILWLTYFLFVYGFQNNNSSTFPFFLLKNRLFFYNIFLVFFVSHFIQRNTRLFFTYLVLFSYIVFILYFTTILTGIELIPILDLERGFTEGRRLFLYSYSFMYWLIPLAIIVIFFKPKIKESKLLIIAGSLMIVLWILSITRRQLIITILYILIIALYSRKFYNLKIWISIKLAPVIIIPFIFIWFITPTYLQYTKQAFIESISIITTGKTSLGKEDTRFIFTQDNIRKQFQNNKAIGTGFDYKWSTMEGDREGFEAADYPFLSALAMFGIVGLLCFFPIYYFIYKRLFLLYKRIIQIGPYSIFPSTYDFMLFLLLLSVFTLELILYMNYFSPTSISRSYYFFIQTGFLLGLLQKTNIHYPYLTI